MCLSTDEKYTELIEAINSLDCKEDIIEVQNKEKDNIINCYHGQICCWKSQSLVVSFQKEP